MLAKDGRRAELRSLLRNKDRTSASNDMAKSLMKSLSFQGRHIPERWGWRDSIALKYIVIRSGNEDIVQRNQS
jgi:hypothetical protein